MSFYLSESTAWINMLIRVQLEGKDHDLNHSMLNPAHALVAKHCDNKAMAQAFAAWIKLPHGGQKIVSNFEKKGIKLYTPAPVTKEESML